MTETFYRIVLILLFGAMVFWGGSIQSDVSKYTVDKPRPMLMVDAYEYYSESGKPGWTGIFRDKEFNTRIENSIEPRTYREFAATNTPMDMVVHKSLEQVKDPKTPSGAIFWSKMLMILGGIGVLWNIIAVIFFRDPWRFS